MADGRELDYFFLSWIFLSLFMGGQLTCSLIPAIVNDQRVARIADLILDFKELQYYIAAVAVDPAHEDDYNTEGWAALRQCSIDGQHILNCAAETRVPRARGGQEEQVKAELQQYVLGCGGTFKYLY